MDLPRNNRPKQVPIIALWATIPILVLVLVPGDTSCPSFSPAGMEELLASRDPYDGIVRGVTLLGLQCHNTRRAKSGPGPVDVCLHPDTSPEDAERILRDLPTYLGIPGNGILGYNIHNRWAYTATDGGTGTQGDPITLTWSIVPDGAWADGGACDLTADFTAAFGGTAWMNKIRNAFQRWSDVIGITYVEVSDDGANMPDSPGVLGVRGDVRIGGRSIDGEGNVLGYNYFPDTGDMVLDTDDAAFYALPMNNYANLKNTVAHEHGHGMGLSHVIPDDDTKLMEPYICSAGAFVGPQDDDIRGGMRDYGDPYENNDTNAQPAVLGTVADTLMVENLSIDKGTTDLDWYLVTLTSNYITVEVDPVGSTYEVGPEGGSPFWVSTDSISDPDISLYDAAGTTLLASATSAGLGETEVLGCELACPGDYQILVYRKSGSGNNVQRYTMTVCSTAPVGIPFADGDVPPPAGLALSVRPNPFNSQTAMRFFATSAGAYTVEVYDVTGRTVCTIDGNASDPGWVEVAWDGRDDSGMLTSSGVYFIRAASAGRIDTRRVLRID